MKAFYHCSIEEGEFCLVFIVFVFVRLFVFKQLGCIHQTKPCSEAAIIIKPLCSVFLFEQERQTFD